MRWLVTGASGQLGSYVLRELVQKGAEVVAWSGSRAGTLFGVALRPVDLAAPGQVATAWRASAIDVILHTAAWAKVSDCQRDPEQAGRVNVHGTVVLAELARQSRVRLIYTSTDLVFNGEDAPYREDAAPAPLSIYGQTKADGEIPVLDGQRNAVVRLSLLFGPSLTGRPAFFDEQLAALRQGRVLTLFQDEWRTPLGLHAAARALVTLAQSEFTGLLHVGGPQRLSRWEMGERLAAFLGLDPSVIVAASRLQVPAPEPRPRDTSLDSSRWRRQFPSLPWPTWEESLRELL